MDRELCRGLNKETNESAEIKMLPTFVTSTPDGTGKLSYYQSIKSVLFAKS